MHCKFDIPHDWKFEIHYFLLSTQVCTLHEERAQISASVTHKITL